MPVCERNKAGGHQLQLESYLGNPVPETRSAPSSWAHWMDAAMFEAVQEADESKFFPSLVRSSGGGHEGGFSQRRLDAVDCNRYARLRGYSRTSLIPREIILLKNEDVMVNLWGDISCLDPPGFWEERRGVAI